MRCAKVLAYAPTQQRFESHQPSGLVAAAAVAVAAALATTASRLSRQQQAHRMQLLTNATGRGVQPASGRQAHAAKHYKCRTPITCAACRTSVNTCSAQQPRQQHKENSQTLAHMPLALVAHTANAATRCRLTPAAVARCRVITAAAAAAAAASSTTVPDLNPRVYLDPHVSPAPFVGPIAVKHIPGKGRGLVATQPLQPGQLLLVTPALALVEGDLGEIPDHDELQEVISSSGAKFTGWQAAWLNALVCSTHQQDHSSSSSSSSGSSSGSGSGSADVGGNGTRLAVPDLLPPAGYSSWYGEAAAGSTAAAAAAAAAAAGSVGSGAAAKARVPFEQLGMSEERLWAAIVLNCYGEGFQDLPATLCSGAPICSQLGLWGPFALLNHSCCPNSVNYTLHDSMVVRAAAAVPAGAELCINYLGRGALRPLSQRQLELQACYGFKCSCDRCEAEAAAADIAAVAAADGQTATLGQLLDSIHAAIGSQYEPRLQALMSQQRQGSDDGSKEAQQQQQQQQQDVQGGLVDLAAEMQQQWEDLQSACVSANSNSSSTSGTLLQAWSEGSAFDLLGLLQEALAAAGEPDTQVLDAMLTVCQTLSPGSDLHVFHALRRASVEQQSKGEGSQDAKAAFGKLVAALRVRYGQQVVDDEELLSKMAAASSRAAAMVAF